MNQTTILSHLAAAAIVTILVALIYATVQQVHRSSANDPQLQIAAEVSNKIKSTAAVDKWFGGDTIEIGQSLSPFIALYDDKGQPVISTGELNGKMPLLPNGVFDFARKKGENVFTWQPERGVRIAVVLRSIQSPRYSFVAAGRSLYEVEKRQENLIWMILISWLLCMGVIMLHWIITFLQIRKNTNQ